MNIDWLAGFYEGEGSISSPKHLYSFGLTIVQKDRSVLEDLQRNFGGSVSTETTRNISKWSLNGDNATKLALELLPRMHHLGKVEQLTKALILKGHLPPRSAEEAEEVTVCLKAVRAYARTQNEKRREERKAYAQSYRTEHQTEHVEYMRDYNRENQEKLNEQHKARSRILQEAVRNYLKEHPETVEEVKA